jgi:hypothetical protein
MFKKKRTLWERKERVKAAWDRIEADDPDISTERLVVMVAGDTGEDCGDVVSLYTGEMPDKL